ncbi:putative ABC transport system permease protein [Paenibacillus endophyticus]|uniref:Putative ABC transport system permease protein n=1 Tax=Paenibacillus endophyticus TaxID=1294268 RepID=A0A7W5G861_9BACL|nr:FtsX-like permease family protein [Paenibacillus endophyticus]MBB3150280.1 putative ABC transport system permease protein [Paenibacillus endophyticus]
MLIKLALSGMKSRAKDYMILLAGLVMSISIFYMFQTMAWNRSFTEANAVIDSIQLVYIMGSFLLSAITLFYILYANGFLLSLRQREYGLYLVLGARKSKIRSLMFIETIAVGILSLGIGLTLGFGLSALVGRLMAAQLQVTLTGYHAIYGPAVLFTVVFFVVLFGLSALWNQLKLARLQVLQLVHDHSQADQLWKSSVWKRVLGVLGLIALGLGYFSLTFMEQLREIGLFTATFMTPIGTYLLFMVLLPPFVAMLKNRNSLRGIRAFTFGQLSFRINGLTKLLATVAMLIALGAGAIAGGMAFINDAKIKSESYSVYDIIVHDPLPEEEKVLNAIPFMDRLQYRYKVEHGKLYYARADLEKQRPLIQSQSMQGKKDADQLIRITEKLPVGEAGSEAASSAEWDSFLWTIAPDQSMDYLILEEDKFEAIPVEAKSIVIGKTNDFLAHRASWAALDELSISKHKDGYMPWSKFQYYQNTMGNASGTFFMGFFLGIAFLAMMASCLMFKVLSGAAKDILRYEMLSKIGVRREKLIRSIYQELFLVFLFPGIAGVLHVLVGMRLFAFILEEPYYKLWIPLVLFAVIYFVYYMLTVKLYQNLVLAGRKKAVV